MKEEELYAFDEQDRLVNIDPNRRCIYYQISRLDKSKCRECEGWNEDCADYESKRQFQDWVNRGGE